MSMCSGVFVTGGTGSLGKQLIQTLLDRYPSIERIVVFSRDELKQYEMAQSYPADRFPAVRFILGDVRDGAAVKRAMEGIETVVHAAALKHVPLAERNPLEAIKTNILGTQNVIDAALACGVKRVVALSTDKAVAPTNLYGATKLCSDKLIIAAYEHESFNDCRFSVVRYGNVFGSRGSVVPFFLERRNTGVLPITDSRMTRFSITLDEAVEFILLAAGCMRGREIFVTKLPSYRLTDLADAIGPDCRREIVGIRAGEKLHEDLITESDGFSTLEFERHFVVAPTEARWSVDDYCLEFAGRRCEVGFSYNSGSNDDWLSVGDLRGLCVRHLDGKPSH